MKKIFLISLVILVSCNEDNAEIGPTNTPVADDVIGVITDTIDGEEVVIYADGVRGILKAFKAINVDNEKLQLSTSSRIFPYILSDQNGNNYDILGQIDNDQGSNLVPIVQVVGYWFFFPSFYHEIQLYNGDVLINPNYPLSNDSRVDGDFLFAGSFPDGIPSIDNPQFDLLEGRALIEDPFYSNLPDEELAIVLSDGGERFIIPHRILEYHEVLNATISDIAVVISYCPLTGTSKAWSRDIKDKVVEFGVSGLLYNNNLVLYDRTSSTDWSQILGLGINGEYNLLGVDEIDLIEMSIESAKSFGSNTYFLSTNTGVSFDYSTSPYNSYKKDERITFPMLYTDNRFFAKERVLGIPFGDNVKIYRFEDFMAEVN